MNPNERRSLIETAGAAGLCPYCENHRKVQSSKGSVFVLCKLSERNPDYARYPRLPVWQCPGFAAQGSEADRAGSSTTGIRPNEEQSCD